MPTAGPDPDPAPTPTPAEHDGGSSFTQTIFGPIRCEGSGPVTLTHAPLEPGAIAVVEPMGRMAAGHVTPTDHLYISNDDPWRTDNPFVVAMPAAGRVIEVARFPRDQVSPFDPSVTREDYRMVIEHTCTFFATYIHVATLALEIAAVTGPLSHGESWFAAGEGISLEAGQAVAAYPGSTVDFMVHDTEVILPGFVVPEHYEGEPWKVHTVDPFDYYEEPVRSQLLSRNPRTVQPYGGKIDYDVDGRAVGNWFLDGTVDYGGRGVAQPNYWSGHLSIVYDPVNTSELRISIGAATGIAEEACRACRNVFGVQGDTPDPADVDVATGLVVYELVGITHRPTFNAAGERLASDVVLGSIAGDVLGVVLVQMVDDRTLRFEVVPGVRASSVTGFSAGASLYRR